MESCGCMSRVNARVICNWQDISKVIVHIQGDIYAHIHTHVRTRPRTRTRACSDTHGHHTSTGGSGILNSYKRRVGNGKLNVHITTGTCRFTICSQYCAGGGEQFHETSPKLLRGVSSFPETAHPPNTKLFTPQNDWFHYVLQCFLLFQGRLP